MMLFLKDGGIRYKHVPKLRNDTQRNVGQENYATTAQTNPKNDFIMLINVS